jgi:hypothetical protein
MAGIHGGAAVIVSIAIIVVVFLVLREVWCWYWKINRMVALLESIDESLKQLPAVTRNKGIAT